MVYSLSLLLSLFLSCKFSYVYENVKVKDRFINFFLLFSPVWIIWLLICGGQYNVGTDYQSYYEIFRTNNSEYYFSKGEWLFASIVNIGSFLKIHPQGMFFIFYFINFLFFFKILFLLEKKHIWIFVLLFITLSNVFNNQLNGLRQYSAIYIITYSIANFGKNSSYFKFLFWVIVASGIHQSALLVLPVIFLLRIKKKWVILCYLMICLGFVFSLFGSYSWLINLLDKHIPIYYASYLKSDYNSSNELIKVLTKVIFVPVYLLSVAVLREGKISEYDKYLYKLGVIAYCIRLFFLENFIFNRVGQTFVLISIFPLYVYMKYLCISGKRILFVSILLVLILFYFSKTLLFPKGEYLYHSIYFQ